MPNQTDILKTLQLESFTAENIKFTLINRIKSLVSKQMSIILEKKSYVMQQN